MPNERLVLSILVLLVVAAGSGLIGYRLAPASIAPASAVVAPTASIPTTETPTVTQVKPSYPIPEGWRTYTEPALGFTFAHPPAVTANCTDGSCTLLSLTQENPEPVPDMTIFVEEGHVEFQSWENFEIPYFEGVVSTFRFMDR